MKHHFVLRFLLTVGIGAMVYQYIDWTQLVGVISRVKIPQFVASTFIFLASFWLLAWRLKELLKPTAFRNLTVARLLNIHMSSMFYGFVAPSDIGTAVARWYQLTRNREGRSLVALLTLLERLLMLAGTALFALVGLYISDSWVADEIRPLAGVAFAVLLLLLVGAISVMFSRALFELFGHLFQKLCARFENKRFKKILGWYWRLSEFHKARSTLGMACIIQLLYQFTLVLRFVLLFYAFGLALPIADITWISMSVILLTAVPITVAGLGIREGGFAAILGLYSVATEIGVLLGLLVFFQVVCAVIWGGISAFFTYGRAKGSSRT